MGSSSTSYTTPGNYTYTTPAGAVAMEITIRSAGGSGRDGSASACGGGGGGGYFMHLAWKCDAGESFAVVVGAGGVPRHSLGGFGSAGGYSSISGTNYHFRANQHFAQYADYVRRALMYGGFGGNVTTQGIEGFAPILPYPYGYSHPGAIPPCSPVIGGAVGGRGAGGTGTTKGGGGGGAGFIPSAYFEAYPDYRAIGDNRFGGTYFGGNGGLTGSNIAATSGTNGGGGGGGQASNGSAGYGGNGGNGFCTIIAYT